MPADQEENALVRSVATRHNVSPDAVRSALRALEAAGGTMAQFSHPEFGGMAQWSRGMSMVGDMFNSAMKAKFDAVCGELADYVSSRPTRPTGTAADHVSYRSSGAAPVNWWPGDLGVPSSSGAQNRLRYAVFLETRRLAIDDAGVVQIFDTGEHRIYGVGQAQGADQTLSFNSQHGIVRLSELRRLA